MKSLATLRIWDRKNKRWREGNFLGGEYFERLKKKYTDCNKKNSSFYLPTRTSLVFADPETGKRLTYNRSILLTRKF